MINDLKLIMWQIEKIYLYIEHQSTAVQTGFQLYEYTQLTIPKIK